MLIRMGHIVSTAENVAEALKMMSAGLSKYGGATEHNEPQVVQAAYDTVLMDLQMPVMDGLESTKRLRALEADATAAHGCSIHQLIVGVSANSDHESKQAAFEAGVDEFMPKPFNSKEFEAWVVQGIGVVSVMCSMILVNLHCTQIHS